jgi:hypothetical protein
VGINGLFLLLTQLFGPSPCFITLSQLFLLWYLMLPYLSCLGGQAVVVLRVNLLPSFVTKHLGFFFSVAQSQAFPPFLPSCTTGAQ